MTDDKELIARLRGRSQFCKDRGEVKTPDLLTESADRIEALTKERDEADDLAKAAFADGASNNIRLAETSYRVKWLEAKLAKAVEVLEQCEIMLRLRGHDEVAAIAHTTLAEIKGESQDGMG